MSERKFTERPVGQPGLEIKEIKTDIPSTEERVREDLESIRPVMLQVLIQKFGGKNAVASVNRLIKIMTGDLPRSTRLSSTEHKFIRYLTNEGIFKIQDEIDIGVAGLAALTSLSDLTTPITGIEQKEEKKEPKERKEEKKEPKERKEEISKEPEEKPQPRSMVSRVFGETKVTNIQREQKDELLEEVRELKQILSKRTGQNAKKMVNGLNALEQSISQSDLKESEALQNVINSIRFIIERNPSLPVVFVTLSEKIQPELFKLGITTNPTGDVTYSGSSIRSAKRVIKKERETFNKIKSSINLKESKTTADKIRSINDAIKKELPNVSNKKLEILRTIIMSELGVSDIVVEEIPGAIPKRAANIAVSAVKTATINAVARGGKIIGLDEKETKAFAREVIDGKSPDTVSRAMGITRLQSQVLIGTLTGLGLITGAPVISGVAIPIAGFLISFVRSTENASDEEIGELIVKLASDVASVMTDKSAVDVSGDQIDSSRAQRGEKRPGHLRPKFIAPSVDALNITLEGLREQLTEFTMFDYVVPTSEGSEGTVRSNPLKRMNQIRDKIRFHNSGVDFVSTLNFPNRGDARMFMAEKERAESIGLPAMSFDHPEVEPKQADGFNVDDNPYRSDVGRGMRLFEAFPENVNRSALYGTVP